MAPQPSTSALCSPMRGGLAPYAGTLAVDAELNRQGWTQHCSRAL